MTEPWMARIGAPGTRAYAVQRAVLLELMLARPGVADRIDSLARVLELGAREVSAAADALASVGAAERDGALVRATTPVKVVEALLWVSL